MTLAELWKSEGRQQGAVEGERTLLKKQLAWRFSSIPKTYIKKIDYATIKQLEVFAKKLLEAKSLEDVFKNYR